jgi:hypothetical protein
VLSLRGRRRSICCRRRRAGHVRLDVLRWSFCCRHTDLVEDLLRTHKHTVGARAHPHKELTCFLRNVEKELSKLMTNEPSAGAVTVPCAQLREQNGDSNQRTLMCLRCESYRCTNQVTLLHKSTRCAIRSHSTRLRYHSLGGACNPHQTTTTRAQPTFRKKRNSESDIVITRPKLSNRVSYQRTQAKYTLRISAARRRSQRYALRVCQHAVANTRSSTTIVGKQRALCGDCVTIPCLQNRQRRS